MTRKLTFLSQAMRASRARRAVRRDITAGLPLRDRLAIIDALRTAQAIGSQPTSETLASGSHNGRSFSVSR